MRSTKTVSLNQLKISEWLRRKIKYVYIPKKNKKTLLWVWKFILKFEKLRKISCIFENFSKNSKYLQTRVQLFFVFFFFNVRKLWRKSVGRDLGRSSVGGKFWGISSETLKLGHYCTLRLIFSLFFFNSWIGPLKDVGMCESQRYIGMWKI